MKSAVRFLCVVIAVFWSNAAFGVTIHVPGDHDTIQAAIDAASNGDTVMVGPGSYNENIVLRDGINLIGSGPSVTTIVGDGSACAVIAADDLVIEGFTITNGNGGIHCDGVSPIIRNNVLTGNIYTGIYCRANTALIESNVIRLNKKNQYGLALGIYLVGSNTLIRNNLILENERDGIAASWDGWHPVIVNNTIAGNVRSGIYCFYGGEPVLKNNIIYGNGQYGFQEGHGSGPTPSPSIYYNCFYDNGLGTYLDYETGVLATVADMETNVPDTGNNKGADPLFIDSPGDNYHLLPGSPCIDAGTSDEAPEVDFDGFSRFDDPNTPNTGGGSDPYYDIGAHEYSPCKGDFDNDGDVDASDLAVFAAEFGRTDCPREEPGSLTAKVFALKKQIQSLKAALAVKEGELAKLQHAQFPVVEKAAPVAQRPLLLPLTSTGSIVCSK
jgi:parallel beta-helix repeat protein